MNHPHITDQLVREVIDDTRHIYSPGMVKACRDLLDARREIEKLRGERDHAIASLSSTQQKIEALPRYRVGLDDDDNAEMFRENPHSGYGDYGWIRKSEVLSCFSETPTSNG